MSVTSRNVRVFSVPVLEMTAEWNFSQLPRLWRSWKYCPESAPCATASMTESWCIPGFFSLLTPCQLVRI